MEVTLGVKEPVHVVHPEAAHPAPPYEPEEKRVHGGEDLGLFHPEARELVDVEEAPVVQLFGRLPPEAQEVGLLPEKGRGSVFSAGASPPVHPSERPGEGAHEIGALGRRPREPPFYALYPTPALPRLSGKGLGVSGKALQSRKDLFKRKNLPVARAQVLFQQSSGGFQDKGPGFRL